MNSDQSYSLKPKKIANLQYKIERESKIGMRVPVKILANDDLLQKMLADRTIEQAINASTLPGVQREMVVLPDGHQGYGFPVGGVAAMDVEEGVISPGSVGFDINCGVRLLRTNLTEQEIKPKLDELVTELFNSIPSGFGKGEGCVNLSRSELDEVLTKGAHWVINKGYGTKDDLEMCEENGCMKNADPDKVSETAHKRGAPQLGSLGSGNHFLEIQKVEKIHDKEAAEKMGINSEGQITVLIHCGSRGLGHQICKDYVEVCKEVYPKYGIELPDKQLACVPNTSEEGEDYKKAMSSALNFAWANRQTISHWTRKAFERVLRQTENDLEMKLVYDVAHNIAKIEEHRIDGKLKSVVVHRKGATRAFPAGRKEIPNRYQSIGQPTFIPGSMGTASWILLGKENSMNLSFGSTAHGAGRVLSRTAAHRNYNYKQIQDLLMEKGIIFKTMTRYGIVEEAPQAYKDVDTIATISHELGISTKVARLVPIGVIKG